MVHITETLKNQRPPLTDGARVRHFRTEVDDAQLFHIEDSIPIPKRGQPGSQVTKEALNKLVYILNNLHPGQSFVFGNLSVSTVRKYLYEMFPELKTRIQAVNKQKGWHRLWLMP